MGYADRDFAALDLDVCRDHAALLERVDQDGRRDAAERQSRDERDTVVAVKTALTGVVTVWEPRRVRYFVQQVPATVSDGPDVDLLKTHDVATELDDHVRHRRKRSARASIDEEDVLVERKVIEHVPRRSRAEKQVPRKNRECRSFRRQKNRSFWHAV